MKKYFTPFNIVFSIQVLVIVLAVWGILPRESVLFLTGLILFYLIFSPLEESVLFFISSIPFFVALPLTQSFDTLANWRILLSILFLIYIFKSPPQLSLLKKNKIFIFILIFFGLSFLSLIKAASLFVGFKKILFLANMLMLAPLASAVITSKESVIKFMKASALAGLIVLSVAFIQLLAVLRYSLYDFWQFWSWRVIDIFYGKDLSDLLSYSNTWFAYFTAKPPILRLFSVLPDSHSLAIFMILTAPFLLFLAHISQGRRKTFFWILISLVMLVIILSGSRGAWLSIAPAFILIIYLYRRRVLSIIQQNIFKHILIGFALFFLMFLISSFYPPVLYKFQDWQTGQKTTVERKSVLRFFERMKSISDINETSNLGRLNIWQATLDSMIRQPFLGVGIGNYPIILNQELSAAKKGASAHNLYFDIAAEVGILGLIIVLLIFREILKTAWQVFNRLNFFSKSEVGFSGAFFIYFIWILGYSLFDVILLNDKVFLFFIAGVSLIYALARRAPKVLRQV